ncbi:30S ribosomal protein S8 [Chloroflexota bacterium]
MSVTDPIADMLTRIRNAIMARHETTLIPASKMKLSIAKILKAEGFINDYELLRGSPHRMIKVYLRYYDNHEPAISGLRRISRPGLRVYMQKREIPRVQGGQGIAILSTSRGVKTGHQAWKDQVGGETLCYIW